jgi:hypothetical protein
MEKDNQIDHVLTDRRQQSNILDIQSFKGADCDLVVAMLRERLSVNNQAAKKFVMLRFDLNKLNNKYTVLGQSLKQVCSFGKLG